MAKRSTYSAYAARIKQKPVICWETRFHPLTTTEQMKAVDSQIAHHENEIVSTLLETYKRNHGQYIILTIEGETKMIMIVMTPFVVRKMLDMDPSPMTDVFAVGVPLDTEEGRHMADMRDRLSLGRRPLN